MTDDRTMQDEESATPVKEWAQQCLTPEQIPTENKREDLRGKAKRHLERQMASAIDGDSSNGDSSGSNARNGSGNKTVALHEESLASIIKDLGPAFVGVSATHQSRICALNVLLGALEGCHHAIESQSRRQHQNQHQRHHQLSNDLMKSLCVFLLNHCGPIEDDNSGDDLDEQIRDVAVRALTVLVSFPTSISNSSSAAVANVSSTLETAILNRINAPQLGVQRRCALPETDDDYGDGNRMEHDYGFDDHQPKQQDFRSGLSHLPRSKRSLCFALVQQAVHAIGDMLPSTSTTGDSSSAATATSTPIPFDDDTTGRLQMKLSEFSTFAASCLHGESDPRCLLQLLKLLHSVQASFGPFFASSASSRGAFPTSDIFDAVAPYFPVHFTPPPNNPYGITREGLHDALMSVLYCTDTDANSRKHSQATMLDLSAGLFLEQLLPPVDQDDEPVSVFEQLEAIDAMDSLLFPSNVGSGSAPVNNNNSNNSRCHNLTVNSCGLLAKALVNVHDDASLVVANNGSHKNENKLLAERTRQLVSKVAFALERSNNSTQTWTVFVDDTVSSLSRAIAASPATCKTSIAYVSCLEACGGPRTLRSCVTKCLNPLIDIVTERRTSNENIVAACYGIGAFFSASRVALQRAEKEGIALTPHPMEKMSSKVFQSLHSMVTHGSNGDTNGAKVATMVAAMRALESVLVGSPVENFEESDVVSICDLVDSTTTAILNDVPTNTDGSNGTNGSSDSGVLEAASPAATLEEWKNACSTTLGYLIGYGLHVSAMKAQSDETVLSSDRVHAFIHNNILPKILQACSVAKRNGRRQRLDRITMALACSCNNDAAKAIVSALLSDLEKSIRDAAGIDGIKTKELARSISFMLQRGGNCACDEFHQSPLPMKILELMIVEASPNSASTDQGELFDNVDTLALPAPPEEQRRNQGVVQACAFVAKCMIPAYSRSVLPETLQLVAGKISNVLPPLSARDGLTLSTMLPILAAALNAATDLSSSANMQQNESKEHDSTQLQKSLLSMSKDLVEFSLDETSDQQAKNAASSCVHSILKNISKSEPCPVMKIYDDVVRPLLIEISASLGLATVESSVAKLGKLLRLMGLLASAAALRGGNSSPSADAMAKFLVDMACKGKATIVVSASSKEPLQTFDCSAVDDCMELMLEASSSFGTILSLRSMSPFTKQRLSHVAMKCIVSSASSGMDLASVSDPSSTPADQRHALIAATCHIVCCSSIDKMSDATVHNMSKIVMHGLFLDYGDAAGMSRSNARKLRLLSLAAATKVITMAPKHMPANVIIVRGVLRVYATCHDKDEVAAKVLSFQALELIGKNSMGKSGDDDVRQAVVSLLGTALNHPSAVLRQAAVDVRNAWYLDQ